MQPPRPRRSSSSPGRTRTAAKWRKSSTSYPCPLPWSPTSRRCGRATSRIRVESRFSPTDRWRNNRERRRHGASCASAPVGPLCSGRQRVTLPEATEPGPQNAAKQRKRSLCVVDMALRQEAAARSDVFPSRAKVLDRLRRSDRLFKYATRACAWGVLALLGSIIISLLIGAMPALRAFGPNFLIDDSWNPVTERFGALAPIYGTLVTSLIAMVIAVPLGVLIALFLTELCPTLLRRPIGIAIELLAGIPSIIYGIWGLFVFAPFLQQNLQPFVIRAFGNIPLLSTLFAGPPYGIGVLTSGLILAIMVLPFITSISRDAFEAVPSVLKEAAYGVGCTTWEVFWNVVVPYTRI